MKKADSRRNAPYVIARHYPLSVIASKRGSACVAAGHYYPPYSRARAPRSGRESVRAYARDLKIRSKL